MNDKTALVLGATGGIGGEMARGLLARGWKVKALQRAPEKLSGELADPGWTWLRGDAMHPADVLAAAQGAQLIVHAVNPPGYRNWDKTVLPMLESSIAAAQATGARLLLPGTVYNFGPDAFPLPTEDAPQHPVTRKGAIRVRMEARLRQASEAGLRVLILRAGDFFGARAGSSWLSQGILKPGRPVTVLNSPGRPGVGHQWAYLPDVTETMLRLVDLDAQLPAFTRLHMQGHWDADGTQMRAAIKAASGNDNIKTRAFPWWLVGLARPFVPVARELWEMRYLWREPVRMPNDALLRLLGEEPHTPLDAAVRTTLQGIGCLD